MWEKAVESFNVEIFPFWKWNNKNDDNDNDDDDDTNTFSLSKLAEKKYKPTEKMTLGRKFFWSFLFVSFSLTHTHTQTQIANS